MTTRQTRITPKTRMGKRQAQLLRELNYADQAPRVESNQRKAPCEHAFNQYTPSNRFCGKCGARDEEYHERMARTL